VSATEHEYCDDRYSGEQQDTERDAWGSPPLVLGRIGGDRLGARLMCARNGLDDGRGHWQRRRGFRVLFASSLFGD
jgi:hypothetical protein